MASIADIFFQALLDDAQLQVDAVRSGDKAGATLGTRMSTGISTKLRAGLGVIAGAASIATKGMLELDDAVAAYTADTGASADEAKRAGEAINRMAGRNIQGVKEIGATLAKVHTDMGLTGDAAEATTEKFLKFANVTKRDASVEVAAFDDILDAWGLTADKANGIMDQLIASHQKFGGSVAADEDALKHLAPAMKALNFSIDDSIGLLNLFKTKGLDAADTTKAFNAAAEKLPKGTSLKAFITELTNIPDPAARARRAVEVFGTKGGVALANALGPGIGALSDYEISADMAAGATDRASEALDAAFPVRIQLAIKGITSKLIELGGAVGPLVTGLASVGTLGAALGLDKFVSLFVAKLAEAGKSGGAALIDAAGTATGAAGTIFGNVIAQPIIDAFDPDKNSLLGKLSRKVIASGTKVGALWGGAMAAGTRLASGIADVLTSLPGSGVVRTAALASAIEIGNVSGSGFGKAFGKAAVIGVVVGLPAVAAEAVDWWRHFVDGFFSKDFQDFDNKIRENWGNNPILNPALRQATQAFTKDQTDLALSTQRLGENLDETTDGLTGYASATGTFVGAAPKVEAAFKDIGVSAVTMKIMQNKALDEAIAKNEEFATTTLARLRKFRTDLEDAFSAVLDAKRDVQDTNLAIAQKSAELVALDKDYTKNLKKMTPLQIQEYRDRRVHILDEMQALKLHLALVGDDTHKITALSALLTSKDMAAGLTSKNAEVKASYEDLRAKTIQSLRDLAAQGGPQAAAATAALQKYFDSTNKASPLHDMKHWGSAALAAYIAGLTTLTAAERNAIFGMIHTKIAPAFTASSPPGPESPLHLIDVWGERTIGAWIDGMLRKARSAALAGHAIAGATAAGLTGASLDSPDFRTAGLARASSVANEHAAAGLARANAAGGDTYVTNLHIPAPPARDPLEAIERAGFYQRSGILNPRLRPVGA